MKFTTLALETYQEFLLKRSIPATAFSKAGRDLSTKKAKQTQVTNLAAVAEVRFFRLTHNLLLLYRQYTPYLPWPQAVDILKAKSTTTKKIIDPYL